ncbi:MAG: TolC family protein [Muribaculaceae bacterium]|nr:TolC family protein [Muribaculaceae bacterium]
MRNPILKIVAVSIIVINAMTLKAETTTMALPIGSPGAWSLDSCISYAINNNLSVKARQLDQLNGEVAVTQAKNNFLPTVNGSVNEMINFGRGLTSENIYANRNTTNFQWGLNASLPLFQGLRNIRNLKYEQVNLTTLLYQVEAAKDDVTLNVITAYLQVLYNYELLMTAQNQLELSTYEFERQKALAENGKIAEIDLLEAESQKAQDELQIVTSRNDYTNSVLDLTQLLQLSSIDNFSIVPLSEDEVLPIIPTAEDVYRSALINNNNLKASRNAIDAAEKYVSVAKSGWIPTLSFVGGIGSSYYTVNGFDNQSFKDQMKTNFTKTLGFSLSIPIFDGLSTKNNVRRARIQQFQAKLQLEQAETELYRTIQTAYYQASGARETYLTSLETERISQEAFNAMQEKYNIGRATPQEFEQSKNSLLAMTLQRIRSRYECLLRYRVLRFYEGNIR